MWGGSAMPHSFTNRYTGERCAESITASGTPLARAAAITFSSFGSRIISRCASTSSRSGRFATSWMRLAS